MSKLSDTIRSGFRAEDMAIPDDLRVGLEPLLKYMNTSLQAIGQVLTGAASISDNLNVEVQTVPLTHNSPQLISLKRLKKAYGVLALSVGSADSKIQYALKAPLHLTGTTVPNQVKVTAWFADSTAKRVPVTFMLTPEGSYSAIAPTTTP